MAKTLSELKAKISKIMKVPESKISKITIYGEPVLKYGEFIPFGGEWKGFEVLYIFDRDAKRKEDRYHLSGSMSGDITDEQYEKLMKI